MAKVMVITLFTLMPARMDASGSWGTARMAFPIRVFFTNIWSPAMMATPIRMVRSTFIERVTPHTLTEGRLKIFCTLWGLAPKSTIARFSRKILMAMAVIRADMEPAFRTGR